MFTASLYFLGIAAFICAALFFLVTEKRAEKSVEADTDKLHAALIDSSTGTQMTLGDLPSSMCRNLPSEEKARLSDWKSLWMQSYIRVKRKAFLKQKAMYSWARTMALCAALCLMGVLLEAEFNQPITLQNILAGFRRPSPSASSVETSYSRPSQNESAPVANRSFGQ